MKIRGASAASPAARARRRLLAALGACVAVVSAFCLAVPLAGCSAGNDDTVVIYSCGEGELNEYILEQMHEDLPEYDIRLHYVSTGNCAARLQTEGSDSEADIVLGLEGGYMRQVKTSSPARVRSERVRTRPVGQIGHLPAVSSRERLHRRQRPRA